MTKEQYEKECALLPDGNYCAFAPLPRWCDVADEYIKSLETAALQPNQEVVTWHDYPDEQPDMTDKGGFKNKKVLIKYRYENAPEELVGIDTYWESPYIDGFESTCDPNVSVLAWAYLPKGVK